MLANAAIGSGWIAASVPPATTTSARPSRIWSTRERDRLVAGRAGRDRRVDRRPVAPTYRLTFAAGAFGISIGTASGETRRGPFSLQHVVVVEQRRDAADAGGHRDAEPLGVEVAGLLGGRQAGVGPGLQRRDHRELRGAVQAAGLDPLEDLGRLDRDRGRRS